MKSILSATLILICLMASADDKPIQKLNLIEGTVVRSNAEEFVVKSGAAEEIAYPAKEVSMRARYSNEILKEWAAQPNLTGTEKNNLPSPRDLKPGTQVKMTWGYAQYTEREKVLQDGNFYQVEILKLPNP